MQEGGGLGVELGLHLGLTQFFQQILVAEQTLDALQKSAAQQKLVLNAHLNEEAVTADLRKVQKQVAAATATLKIGTTLYKSGSQFAVSATGVRKQILQPIQEKLNSDRNYQLRIRTYIDGDLDPEKLIASAQAKLNSNAKYQLRVNIDLGTSQGLQAKLKSAVAAAQVAVDKAVSAPPAAKARANVGQARQALTQLTNTPSAGGLDARGIKGLQEAAGSAGIKTTATGTTELRAQLKEGFTAASNEAIKGLAQGLVKGEIQIKGASEEVGKSLLDALKKSLGIASPSKETRKLGVFSADGFAQGFIDGAVKWERGMAAAIRQAIGNAIKEGMASAPAVGGNMVALERQMASAIRSALGTAMKEGLAGAVGPGIRGALLGGTGGAATGGLVGGATAAGGIVKATGGAALAKFGAAGAAGKLGMLGAAAGGLSANNPAIGEFINSSLSHILEAAMSTGGQGALLGAAGVAGVAGIGGLAKGASGSLVKQAIGNIKDRILNAAVTEVRAEMGGLAAPGAGGKAMTGAGNIFGMLGAATKAMSSALLTVAKELTPGAIQQRINDLAWSIDLASEQFVTMRNDARVVAGKLNNTWKGFSGDTPKHLLPQTPVPGTGLMRVDNRQLGGVVGRTAFGFRQSAGQIGPADIDGGKGYLEQTRKSLQPIVGKPGEWKIVEETNGVWQRIKTDSELIQERLASIAKTMNRSFSGGASMRTWTDVDGIGTFNPFDQPFQGGPRNPAPYSGAGSGSGGRGSVFRRTAPEPPGALALRSDQPVEFFKSFREGEALISKVDGRISNLAKTFDRLGVKSQVQVDQNIRSLNVSLIAVQRSFDAGEIGADDMRAAVYGLNREMTALGNQSARVQNLANAFEDLGLQSSEARQSVADRRDASLQFIKDNTNYADPKQARRAAMAGNARDAQQASFANEQVRIAQSTSGFGGFRGREIGNPLLQRREDLSNNKNAIHSLREYQEELKQTSRNSETYKDTQKALSAEIRNAEMAQRVLNNTASDGERVAVLARNAWGTILDDFQNLVPQLLVFAVAYNLILQRVMTTPGAVLQAAASFERLDTSISSYLSATRGIGDSGGELAKIKDQSLDLGVAYEKTAQSYLKFAAATQGTALQGREAEISRTVFTAGRNQGLGQEQLDRATNALTQILSKGVVQSEELRGQLAEQLPGAVQVAARAFGVTTKELYRMVEAGQIAGDVFVDKFVKQLTAEGADVNRLSGTFANVTEQIGVSIQTLGAAAGAPLLDPLTVALQLLNASIKVLIPVAPLLAGVLTVAGARGVQMAIGLTGARKTVRDLAIMMLYGKKAADEYGDSLTRGQVALKGLKAAGAIALQGLAISAVFIALGGAIKYAKGEAGSLGDEVKRVKDIADGGSGGSGGLNGVQKILGGFNVAQNISDQITKDQSREIGEASTRMADKIAANQAKIRGAVDQTNKFEAMIVQETIKRDLARSDGNDAAFAESVKRIERLKELQKSVKFEVTPEQAQGQVLAAKAAVQAAEKIVQRSRALGRDTDAFGNKSDKRIGIKLDLDELDRAKATLKTIEDISKAAGLLNSNLVKIKSLGAFDSVTKGVEEQIGRIDVNSGLFDETVAKLGGRKQAREDMMKSASEQALVKEEMLMRQITTQMQVQENVLKIKLSLLDSEKRLLESNLSLQKARNGLSEARAQRNIGVAGVAGASEEGLAAELNLGRIKKRGQDEEIAGQVAILGKERERAQVSTQLQKVQMAGQTQQLKVTLQTLKIEQERNKIAQAEATKTSVKAMYESIIKSTDATIRGTEQLIGQQDQLSGSLDRTLSTELAILDIKKQELAVTGQTNAEQARQAEALNRIKGQLEEINTKRKAAVAAVERALEVADIERARLEKGLGVIEDRINARKEESRIAEQAANDQIQVIDKLLELNKSAASGGFFERLNASRVLGDNPEQKAYDLARQRAELMDKAAKEQIIQKRLDLELEKQKLRINQQILKIEMLREQLSNERNKAELRGAGEEQRRKLMALKSAGMLDAQGNAALSQLNGALKTSGFNPSPRATGAAVEGASIATQLGITEQRTVQLRQAGAALDETSATAVRNIDAQTASLDEQIATIERINELDSAQWFAKFIDEGTQLGRVLSTVTGGISEFRSAIVNSLVDGLTGGDPAESLVAAGDQLAKKMLGSIIDEMVMKPIEKNLFAGLEKILGPKEKPEQTKIAEATVSTAKSSADTNQSVQSVGSSIDTIGGKLESGVERIVQAINGIAKPDFSDPRYATPLAASGQMSFPAGGGGGGAFDSGLRTAPSGRNGGSAPYHIDLMFGSTVSLKERVKYMDQLAKGYEKIGRVIEFSNNGVANERYLSTMSQSQKESLITRAQSAHSNRPGGSGRAAMDFYAPLRGSNRFGSSVEGQAMLAPVVPGASYSYGSGGAAGSSMQATKGGRMIYEMLHGDTSKPLPTPSQALARATQANPVPVQVVNAGAANNIVPTTRQATPIANGGGAVTPIAVEPFKETLASASTGAPVPVIVTNQPAGGVGAAGVGSGASLGADATSKIDGMSTAANAWTNKVDVSGESIGKINTSGQGLATAFDKTAAEAAQTPGGFTKLQGAISGVVGALGSIGLGIAGFSQMKEGGTYNTLMGLSGIFGGISGLLGGFLPGGGLGGLFRAEGGPVQARKPYIVGEKGPEWFVPGANGAVVSNQKSKDLFAGAQSARQAEQGSLEAASRGAAMKGAANTPLDVRFESQVINNVEYVTAEQHRQGMRDAAERGRNMTVRDLRHSVQLRSALKL